MLIKLFTKNIFIFLLTLCLAKGTRADCFCGSRDVTPNTYGFGSEDKSKGHMDNLNLALLENFQIASIVNYIDVFLSKFNRLNLKKPSWPIPLKISGVKNLNFMKKKEGFNTLMTHRISQNLYLEIRVEVYNTFKTKGQFNLFANLLRTNFKETDKQHLKKGTTYTVNKQGIMNYPLKRASLSHFYGNQLAVDVCRFMYASVNKIMVDFFNINLQSIVYKEIGNNLRSHKYKKQCIETPSFKVYLGVNQITQMIMDTREKMESHGVDTSDLLKQKLDKINESGGSIDQVNMPRLRRRRSFLLTPIVMDKEGAEMLASDYEGTEEYQRKIKEVYNMDYEQFMEQMSEEDQDDFQVMDEKQLFGKQKQNEKIIVDTIPKNMQKVSELLQNNPIDQEKQKKLLNNSSIPASQKLMPSDSFDPENQGMMPKGIIDPESQKRIPSDLFKPNVQKKMDLQTFDDEPSQMIQEKLPEFVDQKLAQKEKDINTLENTIKEYIIENFEKLPKTSEARSAGYLDDLKRGLTVDMKNNLLLKENLGIDFDEDVLDLDEINKKKIGDYLNSKFVLLRTTPLQTQHNHQFRRIFGSNPSTIPCDNGRIKRGTILGRSKSAQNLQTAPEIDREEVQEVKLIDRDEIVYLTNEDEFKDNQIIQDGLSQTSEIDFTIETFTLKTDADKKRRKTMVDVMYTKNDYNDLETFYNPSATFIKNSKLSPEEREQMLKKIINIANFIQLNEIKCDFELYTDSTLFLNMPDQDMSDMLKNLNLIMEGATNEQVPVLIKNDPVVLQEPKTQIISQEIQEESKPKEMTAEITLTIPGYTKEQVQQMIVLMMQDEGFLTVDETVINDEKQDQLDKLHLVEYDITEHLANDLKNL